MPLSDAPRILGVAMKAPKLSLIVALITFSFHALFAPLHAENKPPYRTVVGGGAYCECKKAPHLATTILLAGVLLAAIVTLAITKPSDPSSHTHSH